MSCAQDSLSGDSKVAMFVNISPVLWNTPETLCSLNFATKCRGVELGRAARNTGGGGEDGGTHKGSGAGGGMRRSSGMRKVGSS